MLTGKGLNWGGSLIRPEATGYGCIYFAAEMLGHPGRDPGRQDLSGLRLGQRGPVRHREDPRSGRQTGLRLRLQRLHLRRGRHHAEKLAFLKELKNVRRGRIKEYAGDVTRAPSTPPFDADGRPLPAVGPSKPTAPSPAPPRTRSTSKDAQNLLRNGVYLVAEGANMPTTLEGVKVFLDAGILYAPGKAANAGGVATSGLEMSQNSMRICWLREEVDGRLQADHEEHPRSLRRRGRRLRHPGQLRERGQHRRLPQGGQRHDGPGGGVRPPRNDAAPPAR